MARFEYKFPELGEGLHEGEIVKLHIKPGDTITDDDVIMEVQNDKAMVEVPSPVNGKVLEVRVKDGDVCRIGDIVAIIDAEGDVPGVTEETDATQMHREQRGASDYQPRVSQEGVVSFPVETETESTDYREVSQETGQDQQQRGQEAPVPKAAILDTTHETTKGGPILATPSVRRFAREEGVSLQSIQGTGKNGRITRDDVLATKSAPQAPLMDEAMHERDRAVEVDEAALSRVQNQINGVTGASKIGQEERQPLKGIRKVIAQAMVKSVYTAPHVTLFDEVNVEKLVQLRKKGKPLAEEQGIKLTYLPFIVKALVAAARKFPIMNASLDEEHNEIVYKKYYHIGIATDTDQGLLVPVIHDADRKSVWTIASEIADLATRGREGKLGPHELKGSTLTITNIGSAGGMYFTPVINFPEVAILGVGKISDKPIVEDGEVKVAPVMTLSLSFDHRLIDGATAQYSLNYIKELLADPDLLLLEV